MTRHLITRNVLHQKIAPKLLGLDFVCTGISFFFQLWMLLFPDVLLLLHITY
uniref:Uncharacterized protein n=1 Tax=Arundo donax TaxID=35708 RepID=A0A0A8ZWE5_ARUDO